MKLRITILKYHSWYLCHISLLIMLLPIQICFWSKLYYKFTREKMIDCHMRCQEWRQISLIHLLVNCHDVIGGIFDRWISPQERMKSPLKWHNLSGKMKKGLVCLCFFLPEPKCGTFIDKIKYDKLNLYHFLFSSQFKQWNSDLYVPWSPSGYWKSCLAHAVCVCDFNFYFDLQGIR